MKTIEVTISRSALVFFKQKIQESGLLNPVVEFVEKSQPVWGMSPEAAQLIKDGADEDALRVRLLAEYQKISADLRFQTHAVIKSQGELPTSMLREADGIVFVLHDLMINRLSGGQIEFSAEDGLLLIDRDGKRLRI